MKLQVVGCSHHDASIEVREQLAFSPEHARTALHCLRESYPSVEAVLLSTCNRTELYTATENGVAPSQDQMAAFLAHCHDIPLEAIQDTLSVRHDEQAVQHLFTVASSLDSMVLGEAQILAQVKQAYQLATEEASAGPLTHSVFQAALKAAKRVACETTIHQRRVSIPSVAVADFAGRIFERFDDKNALVIGAGEMGEETLRYLRDAGVHDITVVNRRLARAEELAARWDGVAKPWDELKDAIVRADLVVSTTGAEEPIITAVEFREIEAQRRDRTLFVLDLAIPRDFDPAIGDASNVYLYAIDDLRQACEQNRSRRDKEMPAARHIIDQETSRFMAEMRHRATGPVIHRLRHQWQKPKEEELHRLFNKLPDLDDKTKDEIRQSFDRMINKLLHPPLESLRHESRQGIPNALLDALARLFQLKD